MGLELPVPNHSTLSRRLNKLNIEIPVVPATDAIHLVVDSTWVKVYGEGEWKTRVQGIGKGRTWRKLHLGVNEATEEIVTAVVTTNNVSDNQVFSDLLDGVEGEIGQVSGDGAYDIAVARLRQQRKCYLEATNIGAKPTIPPRKNAVIWEHGNCRVTPHPRDENLKRIRKVGFSEQLSYEDGR